MLVYSGQRREWDVCGEGRVGSFLSMPYVFEVQFSEGLPNRDARKSTIYGILKICII